MSVHSTLRAFDEWRWAGRQVALVTVIDTEGSTYTKAGHRMLVADNGDYHGLVSGGCLEGDLAEHAGAVIRTGEPQLLTYDLRDEADEIWGLGIGCNGLLRLLVQRLDADHHYQPFLDIAECHRSFAGGSLALITVSEQAAVPAGATRLKSSGGTRLWNLGKDFATAIEAELRADPRAGRHELQLGGDCVSMLHTAVQPIPRLLVIGAGPDAVPLVHLADELGWLVTITDHRPGYLRAPGLETAAGKVEARPGALSPAIDPGTFHAVVVMTHHLDSDRAHLQELAGSSTAYVGLLGPRARRNRLLRELGPAGLALQSRLHGPVGLDIGADSPESIALAIAGELQAHFAALPTPLDSLA
jgi:xanthine dehydrogenase accessory factor